MAWGRMVSGTGLTPGEPRLIAIQADAALGMSCSVVDRPNRLTRLDLQAGCSPHILNRNVVLYGMRLQR